ncbi:DUF397 domain-containing protein [Actinoplanes sp. NBRC 101535]|uniref:DUF397 domain-containing protein n=1 Tax=Actinoplanes sp. NBRC 101535 TaxID=3032196 RepID=UPI0024A54BB7|nr:DUF397 domain-containing protein [Actinoplanes sp. NBRC 101535]GLY08194.1 hypothetical protein Acsp01_85730 [Actinoplanes sp. NBRC 101535]
MPLNPDLYQLPADDVAMTRMCGGNIGGGGGESCATLGDLPGQAGVILGDSKLGDASPTLRFDADEMDALALGWATRRGLTL